MTPATDVSSEIQAQFQKTKGQLFFQQGAGFLGPLLCKVGFMWTRDLPTAAISNRMLYWNPDFFASLDKDTRVTVLAHELWHNGLLHGARIGNRCPEIWNIAGDHVINLLLKKHGYFMGGFPYVMDPQFDGWSTEDIYDVLIQPGQPQPQAGDSPLSGDVLPTPGDQVSEAVGNVVSAATTARISGSPGDVPGETVLVIDHFLNPKLPWETLLFNYFNALTNQEYSFARPNRRYEDPIMRGPTGRNGLEHLIYFVDISGSITDQQILRMNSEVKYIQEVLKPERLSLVTFDTEIHDVYEFEEDEPFEKISITGRGGTSLHDVYVYARAQAPTAMVIFTDLEVSIPEDPGIPIVWVCVDNPSKEVPYGSLIHFSEGREPSMGVSDNSRFTWSPDAGVAGG